MKKEIRDLIFSIDAYIIMIVVGLIIIASYISIIIITNADIRDYFIPQSYSHNRSGSVFSQMGENEKQIYNIKVKNYIGDVKKGSEVKTMIDIIIDMNQSNVGKDPLFLSLLTAPNDNTNKKNCIPIPETIANLSSSGITNWDDGEILLEKCNRANHFDDGNNTTANVADAIEVMKKLKDTIDDSKNYMVTADYEQGLIIRIHIGQLDSNNSNINEKGEKNE